MTFASQHAQRSMLLLVLTANTRKLNSKHNFWKLKDHVSCMLVTISRNGWSLADSFCKSQIEALSWLDS
jgi:hypothetical protein